jgi:hypothetical protein
MSSDGKELPLLEPDDVPDDAIILDGGKILQNTGETLEPIGILNPKAAIRDADLSLKSK